MSSKKLRVGRRFAVALRNSSSTGMPTQVTISHWRVQEADTVSMWQARGVLDQWLPRLENDKRFLPLVGRVEEQLYGDDVCVSCDATGYVAYQCGRPAICGVCEGKGYMTPDDRAYAEFIRGVS